MGNEAQKPGPAVLTAEALLAAEDIKRETIEVPEWGGSVVVQGLSVKAVNEANRRSMVNGQVDAEKVTVQVVIEGMVEPKLNPDQGPQLAEKSMAVINRLGTRIFELSGIDSSTLQGAEARFPEGAG